MSCFKCFGKEQPHFMLEDASLFDSITQFDNNNNPSAWMDIEKVTLPSWGWNLYCFLVELYYTVENTLCPIDVLKRYSSNVNVRLYNSADC